MTEFVLYAVLLQPAADLGLLINKPASIVHQHFRPFVPISPVVRIPSVPPQPYVENTKGTCILDPTWWWWGDHNRTTDSLLQAGMQ